MCVDERQQTRYSSHKPRADLKEILVIAVVTASLFSTLFSQFPDWVSGTEMLGRR